MTDYEQGLELGWDDAANCPHVSEADCDCDVPSHYTLNDGAPQTPDFQVGWERGFQLRVAQVDYR